MSGYMVMAWFGGTNGFYMVNSDTPEGARAEVDKLHRPDQRPGPYRAQR